MAGNLVMEKQLEVAGGGQTAEYGVAIRQNKGDLSAMTPQMTIRGIACFLRDQIHGANGKSLKRSTITKIPSPKQLSSC